MRTNLSFLSILAAAAVQPVDSALATSEYFQKKHFNFDGSVSFEEPVLPYRGKRVILLAGIKCGACDAPSLRKDVLATAKGYCRLMRSGAPRRYELATNKQAGGMGIFLHPDGSLGGLEYVSSSPGAPYYSYAVRISSVTCAPVATAAPGTE